MRAAVRAFPQTGHPFNQRAICLRIQTTQRVSVYRVQISLTVQIQRANTARNPTQMQPMTHEGVRAFPQIGHPIETARRMPKDTNNKARERV